MKNYNYDLVRVLWMALLVLFFAAICNAQVNNFPHTTSFEIDLGDWTNSPFDDFDWSQRSGSSTPSGGTGPQVAPYGADGTDGYAYIESSSPNYPSLQAWLELRADFSILNFPELVVNYHMYTSNGSPYGPGLLQLDVYDGATWTYGVWVENTSDIKWRTDVISLPSYANLPYVILSWTGLTDAWQSDICLDELIIREKQSPLPITLVSFTGQVNEQAVDLEWIVASQVNNDYFTLYRSINCLEWNEIKEIAGYGNCNEIITYNYTDTEPLEGISYYMLSQTDYDGTTERFSPIAIKLQGVSMIRCKFYDILGRQVNSSHKGFLIQVYEDGSSVRRFNINRNGL